MEYYKKYTKLNMFEKMEQQEKELEKYKKTNQEFLEWLQAITSEPYTNSAYCRVLEKLLEIMKKYDNREV
jgi:hypothetical protein